VAVGAADAGHGVAEAFGLGDFGDVVFDQPGFVGVASGRTGALAPAHRPDRGEHVGPWPSHYAPRPTRLDRAARRSVVAADRIRSAAGIRAALPDPRLITCAAVPTETPAPALPGSPVDDGDLRPAARSRPDPRPVRHYHPHDSMKETHIPSTRVDHTGPTVVSSAASPVTLVIEPADTTRQAHYYYRLGNHHYRPLDPRTTGRRTAHAMTAAR
jgi:hypothetical protein